MWKLYIGRHLNGHAKETDLNFMDLGKASLKAFRGQLVFVRKVNQTFKGLLKIAQGP